jgi:hypothetical protein
MKDWKNTDVGPAANSNVMGYLKRFGLRASIIRDDLDQNGQHSEALDKVMYDFPMDDYYAIRTIADQIEKLANGLPD